jgi:APA family basic amino acid/polyamine antiporter
MAETETKLRKTLGLSECIFFGVGSILGAGIYTIIGKTAGSSGYMIWLSFLIASVTALCTAFSYSELSSVFPKSGGEYVYAKKAFGEKIAILLGLLISLNGIVSGAAVALAFAGYFSQLLDTNEQLIALGIIGLILTVNVLGIRKSSIVNIIFTVIEVMGLCIVVYSAFPKIGEVNYFEMPSEGFNGLLTAAALSFFAYLGFEEIVKLSEETKNPQKNIPRALFIATGIVIVIYLIVSIATVSVISPDELAGSKSPLADVVKTRFGQIGLLIITTIALFSTSNTILSNMIGSSRLLLGMSEKNEKNKLLKGLSYVTPKTKVPLFALILAALIMGTFSLIGKIETVALIANFFILITFLMMNISVIVLRIHDKEMERPFRIPGNINNIPLIPLIGIMLILILTGYSIYGLSRGVSL